MQRSFFAAIAAAAVTLAAPALAAAAEPPAYVAGAGGLTPIDTATSAAAQPIGTGASTAVAITPDARTAFVTTGDSVTPGRRGHERRRHRDRRLHGREGRGDHAGREDRVRRRADGTVTPVDVAARTKGGDIPVAGARAVAITPDGKTAYLATATGVTPIDRGVERARARDRAGRHARAWP